MNRRTFLGRFAAIAAAVAVAPAVKAEAAPDTYDIGTTSDRWSIKFPPEQEVLPTRGGTVAHTWQSGPLIMESSSRGLRVVGRTEHIKVTGTATFAGTLTVTDLPLTFESMSADCNARGCELAVTHYVTTPEYYRLWHGGDHFVVDDIHDASDLARVNAWRLGLHDA